MEWSNLKNAEKSLKKSQVPMELKTINVKSSQKNLRYLLKMMVAILVENLGAEILQLSPEPQKKILLTCCLQMKGIQILSLVEHQAKIELV